MKIEACNKDDSEAILDDINTYNFIILLSENVWTPLEFVIKNDEGEPIGGMLAGNWYRNGLEIKTFG